MIKWAKHAAHGKENRYDVNCPRENTDISKFLPKFEGIRLPPPIDHMSLSFDRLRHAIFSLVSHQIASG